MADKTTYKDRTRYVGRITDQGLSKSTQKQTPCALIGFEVMREVTGPDETAEVERRFRRTCTIWLTEKTREYAERDLTTLGFVDFWTFEQLNLSHPDCMDLRGREIEFFCKHEAGNDGNVYERWSVALQGGSALEFQPVERAEVRGLDALFGKGKRPRTPAPVATAPNAHGAAIDDDDLPF